GVENWRGRRALARWRQEQIAKGFPVDMAAVVPVPVPDQSNLVSAPLFRSLLDYSRGPTGIVWNEQAGQNHWSIITRERTRHRGKVPPEAKWFAGQHLDLAAWQAYYRQSFEAPKGTPGGFKKFALPQEVNIRYGIVPGTAQDDLPELPEFPVAPSRQTPAADVLLALGKVGMDLDNIAAEARARPLARFAVHYDERPAYGILLPHLATSKKLILLAQLRAAARLANGEIDGAAEDTALGMRLAENLRVEPFSISQKVRHTCWELALQPLWEGLVDHRWRETDLARFEAALRPVDFLAGFKLSCVGEQCFLSLVPEDNGGRKQLINAFASDSRAPESVERQIGIWVSFCPHGWFLQNEVTRNRMIQEELEGFLQAAGTPAATNFTRALEQPNYKNYHAKPYSFLANWMHDQSWVHNLAAETLRAQTQLNLARVAIALERYRLARGELPEALRALAREYLDRVPTDLVGGEDLHYARRPSGGFQLYSLGPNGRDDGGRAFNKKKPEDDDWAWPGPAGSMNQQLQ
ncbi:MAG TPA: hypothetical protein VHH73_08545, partial [Verrucomicrobiae bacterium]|nr:hypothetical protein [Verrucomicrobiae bacterium]